MSSPARKWPEGEDALAGYSCIVLGDVDPEKLSLAERQRLEQADGLAGKQRDAQRRRQIRGRPEILLDPLEVPDDRVGRHEEAVDVAVILQVDEPDRPA